MTVAESICKVLYLKFGIPREDIQIENRTDGGIGRIRIKIGRNLSMADIMDYVPIVVEEVILE